MNTKQMNNYPGLMLTGLIKKGLLALAFAGLMQVHSVAANEKAIESLQFSSLSGNRVQLQLDMNDTVIEPKVFQTDNPARIALDFEGVVSHLGKKIFPVNQGAATTVYVVEAGGRTRVVVNLVESVDYQAKAEGNKFSIVVNAVKSVAANEKAVKKQLKQSNVSRLIPQQTIKGIDFRRGSQGEGRLLLSLSNPNTVVDVKDRGGKVVLNFLNTKIPKALAKNYDVIDFATPVRRVDAQARGNGVTVTIATVDGNYDYSSFQSDGMLTVEFRPLTVEEKVAQMREKFPFTGDRLSLNFQNIEVRSVLQILADFTELNIIASDSVGGSVTLRLNDVPWDQALALVLKSKGLAKRASGNVIFVAPSTEITKMEEEELAAKKIEKRLEPLKTEYILINYAKVEEIRDMLLSSGQSGGSSGINGGVAGQSGGVGSIGSAGTDIDELRLISRRGTVIVDPRTNMLVVRDTAKQLEDIQKFIKQLDVPVRQVLIESRIVIASTGFVQDLGVKFGVAKRGDINGSKEFGVRGTYGDSTGAAPAQTSPGADLLADLGTALAVSSGGSLAMTLARGADYVLNLEISALQDDDNAELISNPRVMTTDRVQATIKQGVQIPYQTQSQDGPVTELVDAVLQLDVTPQITPNGSVIMELDIKKDNQGVPITTNGQITIPIETRKVTTTVQVGDGETVVLGGIYEADSSIAKSTIPWLSDLPGIGWMFRKTNKQNDKRELLVFVTPKIVKNTLAAN